jgi:hypothetical protein
MKVITLNEIMETLTIVKVEQFTVVTPEADPATTTAMGEECYQDRNRNNNHFLFY